jgi:hypothetical protein
MEKGNRSQKVCNLIYYMELQEWSRGGFEIPGYGFFGLFSGKGGQKSPGFLRAINGL